MPKVVGTDFGTRSKVLIMVFLALKTFDLVPKKNVQIFSLDRIINKTFDLVPKIYYKTFDLVRRSREIRSSDQLPN